MYKFDANKNLIMVHLFCRKKVFIQKFNKFSFTLGHLKQIILFSLDLFWLILQKRIGDLLKASKSRFQLLKLISERRSQVLVFEFQSDNSQLLVCVAWDFRSIRFIFYLFVTYYLEISLEIDSPSHAYFALPLIVELTFFNSD